MNRSESNSTATLIHSCLSLGNVSDDPRVEEEFRQDRKCSARKNSTNIVDLFGLYNT
jgi:hypothetical protein